MNSKGKMVEQGLVTQNLLQKFNEKNSNKEKLWKNKNQSNKKMLILILMPQSLKNCRQGKWEIEVSQIWYSFHQALLSHELVQWKECGWIKLLKVDWKEEIWKISQEEKLLLTTYFGVLWGYWEKYWKVYAASFWFLQARTDAGVRRQSTHNHPQLIFSSSSWE